MKLTKCLLLGGLMAGTALTASARNNVVLFIVDGMGAGDISGAPTVQALGDAGWVQPRSGVDSAAAATAMATGYQDAINGFVSMDANNQVQTTLLEWAKSKRMRGGIVTTHQIGAVVPGAFGAHEPASKSDAAIRSDYLKFDNAYFHAPSLPDILLGCGDINDADYVSLAQSVGYDVVSTADTLSSNISTNKILGLFGSVAPQPTLSQMVDKAMARLLNAYGTFLVVETGNSSSEMIELDKAVQVVKTWADSHYSTDDVIIIVTSTGDPGNPDLPVPLYMNTQGWVDGLTLTHNELFYVAQDGLMYRQFGLAPVVSGLTVSAITATSATVKWTTAEPSVGNLEIQPLGSATVTPVGTTERSIDHTITLSKLSPNTAYIIKASGTDLFQATGSATTTFITPGGVPDAFAFFEPAIGPGSISGTVDSLRAAADSKSQTISETTDGAGLGCAVQYTLQTPVPPELRKSITINSKPTWSALDGTADALISSIGIPAPDGSYYWEKITTFPFIPALMGNYVDRMGNILVRFEDSAAIRRERKDTLSLDYLYATVTASSGIVALPIGPKDTTLSVSSPLAVNLTWSAVSGQAYQVWRKAGTNDWAPLAPASVGATSFSDKAVASGNSYSYAVRALNSAGFDDGNVVSAAIPVPPVVLVAPSGVKAAQGKTGITVSWTDTNTGETGYELVKQCGSALTKISLPANSKSYVDKIYVKGTLTSYTVHALNNGKVGPDASTSITPR